MNNITFVDCTTTSVSAETREVLANIAKEHYERRLNAAVMIAVDNHVDPVPALRAMLELLGG